MIHLLYLAAGSSRRFGANKLLAPFRGLPLFLHGLTVLEKVCAQRTHCTLRVVSQYQEILDTVRKKGLVGVESPQSPLGLSYTIKAGLSTLPPLAPEDFLVFAVADQPFLSEETLTRLLDAARPGVTAACVSWDGQPGNPTLFSASLAPALHALQGDQGGRVVLRQNPCLLVPAASPEEGRDIDTPQDWSALEGSPCLDNPLSQ
ncbi:MAG: nucleotidyltransferase family protein [Evtepia sp.]|uniref:nucleotidyltransferase family protein n=1 Tax=Evtepia sp. TaxID=2773933 RepID=UPI002A749B89|nr:nucleotidyltransferase family protein [Evtepia sp.]MDY3013873.1 nucleotidyltransferase family protein [Evtepia sp.]